MIEANEIRVGNWLNDPRPFNKDTKEFFKITDNGYFKATSRDIEVAELFDPIQLTPELLEKCGYKVQCNYFFFKKGEKIMIEKMKRGYVVKIKTPYSNGIEIAVIDYLHELQNIIYAVSKNELEINL